MQLCLPDSSSTRSMVTALGHFAAMSKVLFYKDLNARGLDIHGIIFGGYIQQLRNPPSMSSDAFNIFKRNL